MQRHYILTTEKDTEGINDGRWVAELRDVDSDRMWLASGNTELESITQVLYKIFETGVTRQ